MGDFNLCVYKNQLVTEQEKRPQAALFITMTRPMAMLPKPKTKQAPDQVQESQIILRQLTHQQNKISQQKIALHILTSYGILHAASITDLPT
jgi:hypothetical protein